MTIEIFCPGEYFPEAYDDTVYVWEDESIAFDALENDYFAGGNASIIEFSKVSYSLEKRLNPLKNQEPASVILLN